MRRRLAHALRLAAVALLGLAAGVACVAGGDAEAERTDSTVAPPRTTESRPTTEETTTEPAPFSTPQEIFAPYEPLPEEQYVNGKRLAGRVAQELATFGPRATAAEIAELEGAGADLERIVAPLVAPDRRSSGEVAYVQLSGVTATTLGTMVIVRQHLEDENGARETVERVMDVRLVRAPDGPWRFERVASVGGTAPARPARLSAAAKRVLEHPNIELPDTARWDIYRGFVTDELLSTLAEAADKRRLAVTVFRTGHPPRVWGKPHLSSHTVGRAVDIYAVDGVPVIKQRSDGSSARQLVAEVLADGARQVGSPWVLPPGGRRSFTDRVHQDHVHLDVQPAGYGPRP